MTIQTKFDFGQIVYLKTDKNQDPWIVCNILVYPGPSLEYEIGQGVVKECVGENELSAEENVLLRLI